jgi:hypothetical protein
MASLPIVFPASINTSAIATHAKEIHPEAIFQTCHEKLLTIHASILYLNKIKKVGSIIHHRSTCNPSINTLKLNNQFTI